MSNYVYAIVNKINLKLYFGSHSWDGEGLDPNYYGSGKIIKQAVKKYGKDNFIIQPIKFYDNVDECRRAEEELLKKYDVANNQYCYNVKNSAIGWDKGKPLSDDTKRKMSESRKGEKHRLYGKHPTAETRRKMSQARKGKTFSDEHRKNLSQAKNYKKTPIVAIDKNGKVKIFESLMECARQLNLSPGNIHDCLKGRRKQAGGYTFKYIEQLDSGIYEGML